MSPRTCKRYLTKVRPILRDLGYLLQIKGHRWLRFRRNRYVPLDQCQAAGI